MSQSLQSPPPSALSDERQMALIIYILFIVPLGVTHIVGLVLAYVARQTAPPWLRTHYTYQIRSFWMGLLYLIAAGLLCVLLIGFVLLPLVFVWFIVRSAMGLSYLLRFEPYPRPESWTL